MSVQEFDPGQLDQGQLAAYNRLAADFSYYFPHIQWDPSRFLNDPGYRASVSNIVHRPPSGTEDRTAIKQGIVSGLDEFFQNYYSNRFEPVDVRGTFSGTGDKFKEISANALQAREAAIQRGSEQAQQTIGTSLARAGLSRSGLHVGALQDVGREQVRAIERASADVTNQQLQLEAALEDKIASLEVEAASAAKGTQEAFLQRAETWQKNLLLMAHQEAAAYDPGKWYDLVGPISDTASQIAQTVAIISAL